jgi:hypothetical protein
MHVQRIVIRSSGVKKSTNKIKCYTNKWTNKKRGRRNETKNKINIESKEERRRKKDRRKVDKASTEEQRKKKIHMLALNTIFVLRFHPIFKYSTLIAEHYNSKQKW